MFVGQGFSELDMCDLIYPVQILSTGFLVALGRELLVRMIRSLETRLEDFKLSFGD